MELKEFEVYASFTVGKTCKVESRDYEINEDKEIDTSDVNWHELFEGKHLSPIELFEQSEMYLQSFSDMIRKNLTRLQEVKGSDRNNDAIKSTYELLRHVNYLISELKGWSDEDSCVVEN